MAHERHLSKAPIREAVLDLRVPAPADFDVSQLGDILTGMDDFENVHEMKEGSVTFQFSAEGPAEGQVEGGQAIGFRGATSDGLWVVQYRVNGMTFSRLQPYSDWAEFSERGRHFVDSFIELIAPEYVERLALRYVNHFLLPYPADLQQYFVGLPTIPEALPQFVSNLLSRVTLYDPERDFSAHVTHVLLDDLDTEKTGFILDVDAFRTTEFSPDPAVFWETFEQLRVFKNQIFFDLITEQNAELHE